MPSFLQLVEKFQRLLNVIRWGIEAEALSIGAALAESGDGRHNQGGIYYSQAVVSEEFRLFRSLRVIANHDVHLLHAFVQELPSTLASQIQGDIFLLR